MSFRKRIGRWGMPPDILQRPHEGSSLENMTIEFNWNQMFDDRGWKVPARDLYLSISPSCYRILAASGRASNLASKLLLINKRMDVIVLDTIAPALLV